MSLWKKVTDPDGYAARTASQDQLNKQLRDTWYFLMHRGAWTPTAAAVAPPGIGRGTNNLTARVNAASAFFDNGVAKALAATDNLWSLAADAASVLPAGSVRRYWLLWDGTTNATLVSVRPSTTVQISTAPATNGFAAGTSGAALANCSWDALPPDGTVICGVLSIVNATNPFIPGTTLLNAAGVTDTYIDGPDQGCAIASIVDPI